MKYLPFFNDWSSVSYPKFVFWNPYKETVGLFSMKNNLFIYRTLIGPEFALHCEAESFIAFWTKSQKRNKLICPKYWNKIWIQIWVAVHRFVALKRLCGPWCGVAHQRRAESGRLNVFDIVEHQNKLYHIKSPSVENQQIFRATVNI